MKEHMTFGEWKDEYSKIIEEHDSRVKSGKLKLEEFDTPEELFKDLHEE